MTMIANDSDNDGLLGPMIAPTLASTMAPTMAPKWMYPKNSLKMALTAMIGSNQENGQDYDNGSKKDDSNNSDQ